MKKCLIALALSVFIGFLVPWVIPASLVTTLFTVAGVMFSVGMSLVVTMSTQNIHHPRAKQIAQTTINNLLHNYIICFLITTLCFAVAMLFKMNDVDAFKECVITTSNKVISFNYPFSVLIYSVYSVCYYVYNMWATRKQHYKIECQIDKELKEDE